MELFADYETNIVKVKDTEFEILRHMGSDIFKLKKVCSRTEIHSYHSSQIEWGKVDKERFK